VAAPGAQVPRRIFIVLSSAVAKKRTEATGLAHRHPATNRQLAIEPAGHIRSITVPHPAATRLCRLAWVFAAIAAAGALITLAALVEPAYAGQHDDHGAQPYAIGLWGDMPYSDQQEAVGLPNLIADMNAQGLVFTVHDGDLKQGSNSACDDTLYDRALGWFNQLRGAAMFTPGDNDWTDCDRASNGGFNSLERLDAERRLFFATPFSLGTRPTRQEVQLEPLCMGLGGAAVPCVENRRWTVGRVVYVTLNVQGSCNNLCDTAPDALEHAARNAANVQWLKDSFAAARARGAVAVMLISQASPGWDASDGTRAPLRDARTLAQTDGQPDGFQDFMLALRTEVAAFRRPVAYVHGDSHYFRIDKPLLDAAGRRLENFTRIETFGDNAAHGTNDMHWVKVLVDPREREVFAFQPMIVPGNRVAVAAP
jgi:hypothetical protein